MRIYKNGVLENKELFGISSDISNYAGIVTVQSLNSADSNKAERPAAQLASYLIGSPVSKFQSLLSSINITPVCANIDKHSKQATIMQQPGNSKNQHFSLRPTG